MTSSASNRLWVSECRSWLRDFRLRWRISDGLIGGKPIRSWFLFLEALRRFRRFRRFRQFLLFSLRILRQSEVSCFSEFILRVYFCDARQWWSLAPLSNFSYLVVRVLQWIGNTFCSSDGDGLLVESYQAQSDVNIMLDGSSYPRWKLGCYALEKLYFVRWKMKQANVQGQWRHL